MTITESRESELLNEDRRQRRADDREPDRPSPATMPTERLEAEIQQLANQLTTGTATLLELIGEFDVRGSWSLFGSLSCAAWLADVCDIEISTARTQVRIARAMRRHPQLHDAVTSRSISYAKARV